MMLLDRSAPGDREKAQPLLSEALSDYTLIGMPRHIEMTQTLLYQHWPVRAGAHSELLKLAETARKRANAGHPDVYVQAESEFRMEIPNDYPTQASERLHHL
jgi:hypothetical protein